MPHVFVPGVPAPQGSKRWSRHGGVFETSKKVGPWRERIALQAHNLHAQPMRGPVSVRLAFRFPRPASHLKARGGLSAAGQRQPFPGRDLDKLARAVLDALTGIAYRDDRQVAELHAVKTWEDPGGVDVIWQAL